MDIDQLYQSIEAHRTMIAAFLKAASPMPPSELSDICMRLAVLTEMLGDKLPELKSKQIAAEEEVYNDAKSRDMSDTGANIKMRFATRAEREEFARAETKHKDLWRLINMAQSHIKSLTDANKSGGGQ